MIEEQQRFLVFFTLCTITTTLAMCGDFFVMMDLPGSWAGSGVLLFGLMYTGRTCTRIYNRFYFVNSLDTIKGVNQIGEFNREFRSSIEDDSGSVINPQHAGADANDNDIRASMRSSVRSSMARNPYLDYDDDPTMESSLRFQYSSNMLLKMGAAWKPVYFVIKGKYGLYYKDKAAFEAAPAEPINQRPILLKDYGVDVFVDISSNANNNLFLLNLIPVDPEDERKAWEFKVDSEKNLEAWKAEFEKVCAKPRFV
jgi:hypothetical protein